MTDCALSSQCSAGSRAYDLTDMCSLAVGDADPRPRAARHVLQPSEPSMCVPSKAIVGSLPSTG